MKMPEEFTEMNDLDTELTAGEKKVIVQPMKEIHTARGIISGEMTTTFSPGFLFDSVDRTEQIYLSLRGIITDSRHLEYNVSRKIHWDNVSMVASVGISSLTLLTAAGLAIAKSCGAFDN